jgi:hypothetical protein
MHRRYICESFMRTVTYGVIHACSNLESHININLFAMAASVPASAAVDAGAQEHTIGFLALRQDPRFDIARKMLKDRNYNAGIRFLEELLKILYALYAHSVCMYVYTCVRPWFSSERVWFNTTQRHCL